MAYCPFQNYIKINTMTADTPSPGIWTYSTTFTQVTCGTTACQVWDASRGDCGAQAPAGISAVNATIVAPVTGGKVDVNATISTAGLATSANQTTEITKLTSIDGKMPNITGLATSANQSTEISSLSTIATKTTSIDNKMPDITGLATKANQVTANTSLSTIATQTTTTATKTSSIDTKIGTFAAGNLATYLQNTVGNAADVALSPAGSILFALKDMAIDDIIEALIGGTTPSATKNILYGMLGLIVPTGTSTLQGIFGYNGSGTDTLKDAINYSGATGQTPPQTLREALESSKTNILKALGFADTELAFGIVASKDDLKRNLGFDNEGGGTADTFNLRNLLVNVLGTDSDKDGTTQTLLMIDKHIHDSHMHANQHGPTDIPTDAGGKNALVPQAPLLISEFMSNQDADGNDKIYGTDFMIISSDEDKPPMLTGVEQNPEWTDPTCQITWAQYMAWVGGAAAPACVP